MKHVGRIAVFVVVALFVLAPIAYAVKDAEKDKGKSADAPGKSDDKGKSAPSAPELPGMWMILGAAAVGGGYLLRKRLAVCPQQQ